MIVRVPDKEGDRIYSRHKQIAGYRGGVSSGTLAVEPQGDYTANSLKGWGLLRSAIENGLDREAGKIQFPPGSGLDGWADKVADLVVGAEREFDGLNIEAFNSDYWRASFGVPTARADGVTRSRAVLSGDDGQAAREFGQNYKGIRDPMGGAALWYESEPGRLVSWRDAGAGKAPMYMTKPVFHRGVNLESLDDRGGASFLETIIGFWRMENVFTGGMDDAQPTGNWVINEANNAVIGGNKSAHEILGTVIEWFGYGGLYDSDGIVLASGDGLTPASAPWL